MTERSVTGPGPIEDRPLELSEIAAADALLDVLARGDEVPEDDALAGVLAAWSADLDADPPVFTLDDLGDLDNLDDLDDEPPADLVELAGLSEVRNPTPEADLATVTPIRRRHHWGRRIAVGVAAAAVLVTGLGIGANRAGPDSPLWPIARVVNPDQVDLKLAEHRIGLARDAIAAGRYDDARKWLDRAAANVEKIPDQKVAARLRAEIDDLRRSLPSLLPPVDPSGATDPSAGPTPGSTGDPGAGGQPGTGGEPGGGQPGGGGQPVVPGLPITPPALPITPPALPITPPAVPITPPALPITPPALPITPPAVPIPSLPVPDLPL